MYRSVDECLRDVFRFGQLRIGPMGNAQQMIEWGESDGILRGKGALTQAEWHANAVMIQSRIARVLSRFEFAAVACYYGGADLHYIVDLGVFIEQQNRGGNLLLCDALLEHLFTGRPKMVQICDRFDVSARTVFYHKKKVAGCVAALLNSAMGKLQPELVQAGVIYPASCSGRQL